MGRLPTSIVDLPGWISCGLLPYRRRVLELERILAERNLQEVADRREMSRLVEAFQPAKIRAWCWTAEARLVGPH